MGHQIFFGGEMMVEGPRCDPGGGADIPDGHFIKADLPGQSDGGVQNGQPGGLALNLTAALIIHENLSLTVGF